MHLFKEQVHLSHVGLGDSVPQQRRKPVEVSLDPNVLRAVSRWVAPPSTSFWGIPRMTHS